MSYDNPKDGDYSWADAPLQQPQPQNPTSFATRMPSAPMWGGAPIGYTPGVPNYISPLPPGAELPGNPLPSWHAAQSHARSASATDMEGCYPPGRYPPPHLQTNMTTCPSELPAHVPVQQQLYQQHQQEQSYNNYHPSFGGSPGSPFYDSTPIPMPMSAPPITSNNPFSNNPFASSPERSPIPSQSQALLMEARSLQPQSRYDSVQEMNPDSPTELPADLELGAKEKSLDSYETLDVYWDQQFSAFITTGSEETKQEKSAKKKKKDRATDVKGAYYFESRPFGSTKAKTDGGDVQLFACRSSAASASTAAESLEANLKRSKSKKGGNDDEWKGDILGCVRYHTVHWWGNWKMHVCMGIPDSDSAHFEWMTQSGVIKDQWLLTGYTFRYTASPNSATAEGREVICRNVRISGTASAIPSEVKRSSRFGNLKMQDADTETTLAVYLNHGMSVSKRGRIMLRKGMETAFRDFAVLVLLGVDERRQRDIRNSSYCASGWWVHMMMRGVSRDEKVKGVKEGM